MWRRTYRRLGQRRFPQYLLDVRFGECTSEPTAAAEQVTGRCHVY